MTWYVLRRLGLLLVAIVVASVVIFLLLRLLPGDLAGVIGGTEASPERIEAIREELGLDRPLVAPVPRLGRRRSCTGDFGDVGAQRRDRHQPARREADRHRAARPRLDGAVDARRRAARDHRRRPPPPRRRHRPVGRQPARHRRPDVLGRAAADRRVRRQLAPVPGPGLPARRAGTSPAAPSRSLVLPTVTLAAVAGRGAAALRALGDARRAPPGLHPHGPGQGPHPHPGAVPPRAAQRRRCRSSRSSASRSPA